MIARALIVLFLLAGCGRPLTETEMAFAQKIAGSQMNLGRVRIVEGSPAADVTFRRKARPQIACRERIVPPPQDEIVTASPVAVALFNHLFFDREWYTDNYMPEYPDRVHLVAAMLLAHELTHVWQWQNRRITGYHPIRAATEHSNRDDPYLFELDSSSRFLDYGYEQQGSIVEEYVCCRALAPQGARTKRLHSLLGQVFPVADLPANGREADVYLPWKDADLKGICN